MSPRGLLKLIYGYTFLGTALCALGAGASALWIMPTILAGAFGIAEVGCRRQGLPYDGPFSMLFRREPDRLPPAKALRLGP